MDINNLTSVYNQNPTLQGQYTLQQYLDMFGGSSTTPPATIQPVPTPNVPEKGIINQNINQYQGGGGGGGIQSLGSENIGQRTIDFNEAITSRQSRLNNPGTIQSFVNNYTGGGQSPAFGIAPTKTTPGSLNTSMLARGTLGQKDTRATSGIPLGISGMLARAMPDNYYDKMTLGEQIMTQANMGYTDANGMSNKDPFGINTRSAFGNYGEYSTNRADKLAESLAKSAAKKGLSFDPITGKATGTDKDVLAEWNRMNNFNLKSFGFYNKNKKQLLDIRADLALIQKAKEEKAKQDAAKAAAQLAGVSQLTGNVNTGGGKGIASSGVASGNVDPSGMGGGSRQAKSSGSQNTSRTDGGWGWAKGGFVRGNYFKGGIVSLRRR